MKKKNIIVILVLIILLMLFVGIILIKFNNKNENQANNKYDFTNKIFHYSGYIENTDYNQTYIFISDGTFYSFTTEYDEKCTLRAVKGTWKDNDGIININYNFGIFYNGGELIDTEDMSYFGKRRVNYSLIKKKMDSIASLKYKQMNGVAGDKYMEYLSIDESTYYPIYEFETEEDLYKKLEEMYGEIYTMLVDDSIEVID